MRNTLFVPMLLLALFVHAQHSAFDSGERLTFGISYQTQGIYTSIGEIQMNVDKKVLKGKPYFRFWSTASTYNNYDRIFKIRDYFESYSMLNSLRPIYHRRSTKEGVTEKEIKYSFNWNAGTANFDELKKANPERPNSRDRKQNYNINLPSKGFDILSALYYIRANPLDKLKSGNRVKINTFFDGKVRTITFKYMGKKTLNTKIGQKSCHHFSSWIQGDDSSVSGDIYLTADENKIPVLINANIPVGKGKIELVSASGLKN